MINVSKTSNTMRGKQHTIVGRYLDACEELLNEEGVFLFPRSLIKFKW